MRKGKLFIIGLLFCALVQGQQTIVRRNINFDEGWKFHLGNASNPYLDFNYGIANIFSKSGEASNSAVGINFHDENWENVQLPHDWVVGFPFEYVHNEDIDAHGYKPVGALFPQNSIGWYRKSFTVNHSDSGGRYVLRFDGVYRDSKVWVNGYYVGGNFSGYNSANYDITDFIRFGQKNVITVRADATQVEGWFYEGAGIYRHAWLENTDNLHLTNEGGVFVHTNVQGKDAVVTVESTVENRNVHDIKHASVSIVLTDRTGKVLSNSEETEFALYIN